MLDVDFPLVKKCVLKIVKAFFEVRNKFRLVIPIMIFQLYVFLC
jgi:hypothetical protein